MDAAYGPLLFLAAIALAMIIFFASRSRMRRRLEPLAVLLDEHGGDVTGLHDATLSGHFRNREAAFILIRGGRHSPRKFIIEVGCRNSLPFEIYREGLAARFGKTLHLLTDVEIGDSDLDQKLVFRCKERETFSRWMASAEVKEAVASLLLTRDVDRLSLESAARGEPIPSGVGKLRAIHIHYRKEDFEIERVREILGEMEMLARSLDAVG